MGAESEDRYVSLPELKQKLLKELEEDKDDKSDTFVKAEKQEILKHADAFSFLSLEDTEKLIEELKGIERISTKQAFKIAEILPQSKEEVRAIFAKEIISPTDEEITEILDTILKFV